MTTFSEKSNLPSAPISLTPAADAAWSLVRELHGQARISAVEGRALLEGLRGASAPAAPVAPSADLPVQGDDLDDAIAEAVRIAGSQARLADLTGISQQHISRMLTRKQPVSADSAVKIEAATLGRVSRARLRPDLWPEPAMQDIPEPLRTVADLFDRFHGTAALGRVIAKAAGAESLPYQTLAAWKLRGSIPIEHWPALISAARSIGLDLDEATLVRLHLADPARETAP